MGSGGPRSSFSEGYGFMEPVAEIRLYVRGNWRDIARGEEPGTFRERLLPRLTGLRAPRTGLQIIDVEVREGSLEVLLVVGGALAFVHKLREAIEDIDWLAEQARWVLSNTLAPPFLDITANYHLDPAFLQATSSSGGSRVTRYAAPSSLVVILLAYLTLMNVALLVSVVFLAFK